MKTAIVDDDPIVCQSLATILAATGAAEVLWTANNETDAVERYRSGPHHRPDVLLLDIQMPGVSGLDTARRILAFDHAARILFLTTFSDRAYIDEAIAIGRPWIPHQAGRVRRRPRLAGRDGGGRSCSAPRCSAS